MSVRLSRQRDKLEFAEESAAPNNTVIPNQCALLSWESPSNFELSIVIQTVLLHRFLELFHEKLFF